MIGKGEVVAGSNGVLGNENGASEASEDVGDEAGIDDDTDAFRLYPVNILRRCDCFGGVCVSVTPLGLVTAMLGVPGADRDCDDCV